MVSARGPYHKGQSYRLGILQRDGFRCQICGCAIGERCQLHPYMAVQRMDVGHIIPWADGGPSVDWNLRAECHNCNLMHAERHARPEETMAEYLASL